MQLQEAYHAQASTSWGARRHFVSIKRLHQGLGARLPGWAPSTNCPCSTRNRHCLPHAAGKKGSSDADVVGSVKRLADSVLAAVPSRKPQGPPSPQAIHFLIAALLAVWLLTSFSGSSISPLLSFSNSTKHWWTFATSGFHTASSHLLATALFMSYMFGRSLENSQGPWILLLTFVVACIGGCLACAALLPRRAALSDPGLVAALFGLFAGATLLNPNRPWHWQRFVELLALCPFVLLQLIAVNGHLANAVQYMGVGVGAWVPLVGGFAGAAMVAAAAAAWRALVRFAKKQQQPGLGAAAAGRQQQESDPPPVESVVATLASALLKRVLS